MNRLKIKKVKTKRNERYLNLDINDFADLFGTTRDDFSKECKSLIQKTDFRYKLIRGVNRDAVILDVIKKINSAESSVPGSKRRLDWERGWRQNLEGFINSGYDLSMLIPRYFKPNQLLRLRRQYIKPLTDDFQLNFSKVLRTWLITKYLNNVDNIYEFGCGTGYHLVSLAKLFPSKKIFGFDWAEASKVTLNLLASNYSLNIKGGLFDFYKPDENIKFTKKSVAITMAALEQVGENYGAFLRFLLEKSPSLCLNIEPLCELYDKDNLIDYLALRYHQKRHYLNGFLSSLRKLEDEGRVEIIAQGRPFFGSLCHEAYSFVVWRPTGEFK
ncbi:MAG: hypothetical protein ACYDEX_18125 [Mobilitalea sp.]